MKTAPFIIMLFLLVSCGKNKTVVLPEIPSSKISKIQDVSAAYLFYNETLPEHVELNRKNLISTTNWLVNVDKRLTLKEAVPQIIFLQNKKRNAEMHKNEDAKNYFTCNDLSKNNLGFIEFTDVYYHNIKTDSLKLEGNLNEVRFFSLNNITIITPTEKVSNLNKDTFKAFLKQKSNDNECVLICNFHDNLSFQDYMTIKYELEQLDLKNMSIAKDEFIFN